MKKLLLALSTALTLAACSGAPSTPTPAPKTTLYQGDWIWVAVNANNTEDYVGGLASFSVEVANKSGSHAGQLVAGGVFTFSDAVDTVAGISAMGPISTPLDVAFSDTSANTIVLAASDLDGTFEAFKSSNSSSELSGKPAFVGSGRLSGASGSLAVNVILVQRDTQPSFKPAAQASKALTAITPRLNTLGQPSITGQAVGPKALAVVDRLANAVRGATPVSGHGPLSLLMQGK